MDELKRKMKMAEDKQKANEIIKTFDKIIVNLDNGISKCRSKAQEALVKRNDMTSFHTFARYMKCYQGIRNNVETIKCQFENYLIQVEVSSTFVGLKSVLASTAKMMDSMPSLKKNNKDFRKFKKSIMKGQLCMESINGMMGNLDSSTDSEMTEEELGSLKDEILMTSSASDVDVANDTNNSGNIDNETSEDDDFFSDL